jgi:hypothetical protein
MRFLMSLCLALACVAGTTVKAEPWGGEFCTANTVLAGETNVHLVDYHGDATAMITLSGDLDTDLDIVVLDPLGNVVAADATYGDQIVVVFQPTFAGTYSIAVVNHGYVYNDYVICFF